MSGFRTEQERIDNQTMEIENPNVVGSGFIQHPPQRPNEKAAIRQQQPYVRNSGRGRYQNWGGEGRYHRQGYHHHMPRGRGMSDQMYRHANSGMQNQSYRGYGRQQRYMNNRPVLVRGMPRGMPQGRYRDHVPGPHGHSGYQPREMHGHRGAMHSQPRASYGNSRGLQNDGQQMYNNGVSPGNGTAHNMASASQGPPTMQSTPSPVLQLGSQQNYSTNQGADQNAQQGFEARVGNRTSRGRGTHLHNTGQLR